MFVSSWLTINYFFLVNIVNKKIGNKHRTEYFIVFHFLTKCTGYRLEVKLVLEDSLNHFSLKKMEVFHHL